MDPSSLSSQVWRKRRRSLLVIPPVASHFDSAWCSQGSIDALGIIEDFGVWDFCLCTTWRKFWKINFISHDQSQWVKLKTIPRINLTELRKTLNMLWRLHSIALGNQNSPKLQGGLLAAICPPFRGFLYWKVLVWNSLPQNSWNSSSYFYSMHMPLMPWELDFKWQSWGGRGEWAEQQFTGMKEEDGMNRKQKREKLSFYSLFSGVVAFDPRRRGQYKNPSQNTYNMI